MKTTIIVLGALLACAAVFYLFIRHYSKELRQINFQFTRLPSGKELPADADLVRLSKEQLEGFVTDDLAWLEEYALMKKTGATAEIQAALWDDLLRRIDIAMNGF